MAEILKAASEKEWKDKLLANTQKALDLGAFGAPWFWVRNGEGKEEPFFGSDRYVVYGDECRKEGSANFSEGFISCGSIWVYRSRILRLFLKGGRRLSCNFFYWGRIKSLMKLFVFENNALKIRWLLAVFFPRSKFCSSIAITDQIFATSILKIERSRSMFHLTMGL